MVHLDRQIALVDRQIEKLVKSDPLLKTKFDNITKVKGIGVITFATIVAETNGFELFDSQRQLISYAGYDVVENQSGNKTGKTRISKKGNAHIRRALHMPSLIAVKNNEAGFRSLYERVYERTRIKMKGYVAVQKKLLCLVYSLWKSDSPFDPHRSKNISGNQEPKALFPVDSERIQKRSSATEGATLDGLPCNQSPEGLFPVIQKY